MEGPAPPAEGRMGASACGLLRWLLWLPRWSRPGPRKMGHHPHGATVCPGDALPANHRARSRANRRLT